MVHLGPTSTGLICPLNTIRQLIPFLSLGFPPEKQESQQHPEDDAKVGRLTVNSPAPNTVGLSQPPSQQCLYHHCSLPGPGACPTPSARPSLHMDKCARHAASQAHWQPQEHMLELRFWRGSGSPSTAICTHPVTSDPTLRYMPTNTIPVCQRCMHKNPNLGVPGVLHSRGKINHSTFTHRTLQRSRRKCAAWNRALRAQQKVPAGSQEQPRATPWGAVGKDREGPRLLGTMLFHKNSLSCQLRVPPTI